MPSLPPSRPTRLPTAILQLSLALLLAGPVSATAASATSQLWGRQGEAWQPTSRLPDFSYAGYHRGERSLPRPAAELNVKTFGAKGDGQTDDTAAFQKAIAAAAGKVLAIPAGRYLITDFLQIRHGGTILQGAGPDRSILFFPTPLNEIKPNWGATTTGQRTSNYSWSGGFIQVAGTFPGTPLAEVTQPARRGDQSLTVSTCQEIQAGDDILLTLRDTDDNSLAIHLYAGDPGPLENLKGRARESFAARVTRVEPAARRISFDRPLRTDVQLSWQPRLYSGRSSVEEVGLEQLGFEFPNTPYQGHFTELGYNAIAISRARHCWIRHIRIHNADSGIFVSGQNVTLHDILLSSERQVEPSRKATGHHGFTLNGQDNLLTRFHIQTRFMHDITLTGGSAGNVISAGDGLDLALDHHCHAPHANLFTDLDLGLGSRMFQSGGGAALGRHSAAYETFWNIRAQRPQAWPQGWGPNLMNLIAVTSDERSVTDPTGRWFEAVPPGQIIPANLHHAQQHRRLAQ